MRVELHLDARAELRSAALWYDERRVGLGGEFIAEVSAAVDRIGQAPESFPRWPGTHEASPPIRKATIHQFPYLIAFETHERIRWCWRSHTPNVDPCTGSCARTSEGKGLTRPSGDS